MITYCTGSARQKRDYFKEASGVTVLDNIEVLFCASENGKNYFAYGDVPFGGFTVMDYLAYRRALCKTQVTASTIKKFGLSPKRKLSKLSPAQMRIVQYLEKGGEGAFVINLDGAKYTRRDKRALDALTAHIGDCYVCVTDSRFVSRGGADIKVLSFGKSAGCRPSFYAAKRLAKKIGAKKVSVM